MNCTPLTVGSKLAVREGVNLREAGDDARHLLNDSVSDGEDACDRHLSD